MIQVTECDTHNTTLAKWDLIHANYNMSSKHLFMCVFLRSRIQSHVDIQQFAESGQRPEQPLGFLRLFGVLQGRRTNLQALEMNALLTPPSWCASVVVSPPLPNI